MTSRGPGRKGCESWLALTIERELRRELGWMGASPLSRSHPPTVILSEVARSAPLFFLARSASARSSSSPEQSSTSLSATVRSRHPHRLSPPQQRHDLPMSSAFPFSGYGRNIYSTTIFKDMSPTSQLTALPMLHPVRRVERELTVGARQAWQPAELTRTCRWPHRPCTSSLPERELMELSTAWSCHL